MATIGTHPLVGRMVRVLPVSGLKAKVIAVVQSRWGELAVLEGNKTAYLAKECVPLDVVEAPADMKPVELLRRAITISGLSARRFAYEVLARDERVVRRWLAGDTPLPAGVQAWLRSYVEESLQE